MKKKTITKSVTIQNILTMTNGSKYEYSCFLNKFQTVSNEYEKLTIIHICYYLKNIIYYI